MRYYWGLAVGHTYSHVHRASSVNALCTTGSNPEENDDHLDEEETIEQLTTNTGNEPEYSLDNLEDECPQTDEEQDGDDDDLATGSTDMDLGTYQEMYE